MTLESEIDNFFFSTDVFSKAVSIHKHTHTRSPGDTSQHEYIISMPSFCLSFAHPQPFPLLSCMPGQTWHAEQQPCSKSGELRVECFPECVCACACVCVLYSTVLSQWDISVSCLCLPTTRVKHSWANTHPKDKFPRLRSTGADVRTLKLQFYLGFVLFAN